MEGFRLNAGRPASADQRLGLCRQRGFVSASPVHPFVKVSSTISSSYVNVLFSQTLEDPRVQAQISQQLLRQGDGWHCSGATAARSSIQNAPLLPRACLLADAGFLSEEFLWKHQLKVFSASMNRLLERWRSP